VQIERDRTVMDRAEGAVACAGADDDDQINYGSLSMVGSAVRARDKSEALKGLKAEYNNRLGHIISTLRIWKLFGDVMGADPTCRKWVFWVLLVHWGNGVGDLGFWGNGAGRVVAWGHLSFGESEGNWGNWGNWVVVILSCCPVPNASRV